MRIGINTLRHFFNKIIQAVSAFHTFFTVHVDVKKIIIVTILIMHYSWEYSLLVVKLLEWYPYSKTVIKTR